VLFDSALSELASLLFFGLVDICILCKLSFCLLFSRIYLPTPVIMEISGSESSIENKDVKKR